MHIARYVTVTVCCLSAVQCQPVIIHKTGRHFYQRYIPRDAAIIPPVRFHGGHSLRLARVVHRDHRKVAAVLQRLCYITIELCKAALVLTDMLVIHKHGSLVIHRAEMQKHFVVAPGVIFEVPLIPQQAFVVVQLRCLRVPVTRHLQCRRLREVIFQQRPAQVEVLIGRKARLTWHILLHVRRGPRRAKTIAIGINDVVPVTIQARSRAMVRIHQQCRRLAIHTKRRKQAGC